MVTLGSGQQFDLLSSSRQAKLNAWLAIRGVQKKDLAEHLGVHPSMITRILSGDRRPSRLIAQLIALGIPANLLPEPGPTPGRPAKPAVLGRTSGTKHVKMEG